MISPPPPQAVVFDMDGLMFNTEELYQESARRILTSRGLELDFSVLDRMMGRPGPIALQIMIDHYQMDATPEQLQQETTVVFRAILEQRLSPMPGLISLLEALEQASMRKAVATSSRADFARQALGQFHLPPRFEFILTGESVQHGKPSPDIYLLAADRLGIEPPQMVVLEDSQNGCQAAVAAGACAIAVPGPHSRNHDFSGARLIADSLQDPRLWRLLNLAD